MKIKIEIEVEIASFGQDRRKIKIAFCRVIAFKNWSALFSGAISTTSENTVSPGFGFSPSLVLPYRSEGRVFPVYFRYVYVHILRLQVIWYS